MNECQHVTLTKSEGPLHEDGKRYYCEACGEPFKVESAIPGPGRYGTKPQAKP
jgi:hypothetical protein